MDRTKAEVIKSIQRFKDTGKLPRDYDVITKAPTFDEDDPNYIENVPQPEPFESVQAGVLADHMD